MIFADAHVHIYDCFDTDIFFDSALKNFQTAVQEYAGQEQFGKYILLLATGRKEGWFENVRKMFARGDHQQVKLTEKWSASYCHNTNSLAVFKPVVPDKKLHLVAGCQVVTKEQIEVLGLFCPGEVVDGLSLSDTVRFIIQLDAIPVLPWGVGKWIGKRGECVRSFLTDSSHSLFFVGDNGGRPKFWPTPKNIKVAEELGISVLPGTDPLPMTHEASRVGSFGFHINSTHAQEDSPVGELKQVLQTGVTPIVPYGKLQSTGNFLLNQLRLRFTS